MTSDPEYIEVAVALPVYRTFTYSVPETFSGFTARGKRVLAPFGLRRVTGYVFGQGGSPEDKEIKPILDVLDDQPLFTAAMIPFFQWIADYYKYPIGEVVKNALPGGLNVYEYTSLTITPMGREALNHERLEPVTRRILEQLLTGSCRAASLFKTIGPGFSGTIINGIERKGWIDRKRKLSSASTRAKLERFVRPVADSPPAAHLSNARRKILEILKSEKEISVRRLKRSVPSAAALVKSLAASGYLMIESKRVYRDPFGDSIEPDVAFELNREQQQAVTSACDHLDKGYRPFLLRGVTGSGKTEVYMQVAARVLKKGRLVLVLVPEIALITQMERRFRARFGDCVCVLHSALSAGERYDQWTRILQKEATVVIGARSAIFAPLEDLGVIIVDEEHDSSYKQEGKLRYNARDLAVVRAKLNDCIVILGSATPSVQSAYNAANGKFAELTLTKRVEKRQLPEIQIVDLRRTRDARGIKRFITDELHRGIKMTLERKEQVLLFLNRRGYASFPVCAACGQPMRCKHCDISLTLHQRINAYRCHYCGYSRAAASSCDICGSTKIKQLGLGTEKLEDVLQSLFKEARIARMDRDTTTRKGSIVKLLRGLNDKTIDILIGTQMVAKGHDFPAITLVGIICADLSLSFPDFRAGERTFQLLAQVAGRAGRGNRPGKVVLQTYNPDHFCISAARRQDFDSFYRQEIGFRKALSYPPFTRMVQLKISGKDPGGTEKHAHLLGDHCRKQKSNHTGRYQTVEIMGPIEASLARIARRHRWQILLKCPDTGALHQFINQLMAQFHKDFTHRQVKVAIDVDPVFLM